MDKKSVQSYVTVASTCLLWEPDCPTAELGSVYEESGCDSFKNKSQ